MNVATMLIEARLILGEPDASQSHFTDAQLTSWANEFYRLACVKLRTVPYDEDTYATPASGSSDVTIDDTTITIDIAKIYVRPDNKWRKLKIIDLEELLALDEDWEGATAGVPVYFVKMDAFTYKLYPPPNSSIAGQSDSIKVYGVAFRDTLDVDSASPLLPIHIHDLFPFYIAYRGFLRLGDKDSAANQLIFVREFLKEARHIAVNHSKSRGWRVLGAIGATPNAIPLD